MINREEGWMEVDLVSEWGTRRVRRSIDHYEAPPGVHVAFMSPVPRLNEGERIQWLAHTDIPLVVIMWR